ncbi:Rrf2 family transcriptional regulator [Nonomuraea sp. 3-1Str]|uniref:RrF2 family transcriptional regulator n=1 Tax=Nonomuraea sp. 3-1Str TaxID=2929801 RepID=UPI00286FDBA1|nr:Rrf2 family transcriptional regulator [Nonomuraea sp. 3-1Str]
MRLTAFTDISLRIVMRLAVARREELMTTRAVAGLLAVPYAHAAKAVARLSELGLVEARRGRGGGLQLTEKGRRASVGGIVRALESAGDVEIPEGAVAYLCGPLPFMRDARAQLIAAGVAPRDVHYEVFGPDLWLARGQEQD